MDYDSNISIDIVEYDDLVVIAVEGEVDLTAAPLFEESLAIADATDAATIVVDLDRVSFMDSSGVHVLLQFSVSEENRGRLRLTRGSPQVRRLVEVTGVRRFLTFGPPLAQEDDGHQATGRLRLTG
ncbi:MAG TPA: STAS domain-containing protein [Solirubrobacteraceae bacterium]|nr:STAS domain-containing protein [Solirubrobacteraceae bacterium]